MKILFYMLTLAICILSSCTSIENTEDAQEQSIIIPKEVKLQHKLKFTSGICSILHDSQGNYWFGSYNEGVAKFDGNGFTYFAAAEGIDGEIILSVFLVGNQVRTIQEDNEGIIWFGTDKGVSAYQKGGIFNPRKIEGNAYPDKWALSTDDVWFNAGNYARVARWQNNKLTHLSFPLSEEDKKDANFSTTAHSKGKGKIWIATYTAVFGYDGKNMTIINDDSLGLNQGNGRLHVRSILEDSKGRLWIGNNGIGVLLKEGDEIINFSEKQNLVHYNSQRSGATSPFGTLEHVFAIEEDKEGNIWFGDRDTGVWKYDGRTMENIGTGGVLSVTHIWEIYQDPNGELLFGTQGGGVYRLVGKTFERKF